MNKKAKKNLAIVADNTAQKSCATPALSTLPLTSQVNAEHFKGRAAVVTLGCAKNQVDSEVMLGVLKQSGYELVADVNAADVAIVNTCGFLESAVKESIDCVLDLADLKKTGQLRKLIVAGCAVSRYRAELVQALPEADAFVTLDDILNVGKVALDNSEIQEIFSTGARPYFLYDETMPRVLSGQKHSAYVKIAEGCNRPCTFCIIPKIRGAMRSRTITSVVSEVNQLVQQGVQEVNLVAQDLTSYGSDRGQAERLSDLLQGITKQTSLKWLRLLYAYPIGIDHNLLSSIVNLQPVCNYLDLPLQHASESVLKVMQRPLGRYSPLNIIDFITKNAPEIKLRTTFIVGFPGETDQDIEQLAAFVNSGVFSSVGIFTYSPEIDTPAAELKLQISEKEKKARQAYIMSCQKKVVANQLKQYVGQSLEVMVDGLHEDSDLLVQGRTYFQAPEVDGCVIINDSGPEIELLSGNFYQVEITDIAGYDLIGRAVRQVKSETAQTHAIDFQTS